MINGKKVLAVILARGGSKGIKKKNITPINGHPLISYSIAAALNSKHIDKLVVSSDSQEILKVAKDYGADVPFVRPNKFSGDTVPSVTALKHAVIESEEFYNTHYDYIVELPCVSPLRDSSDVDKVLKILDKKKMDSVISYVSTGEKHPIRLKRIKKNIVSNFCKEYPEPDIGSRRQDFEASYIRNGAIYSMKRDILLKKNSRNGKKTFPFIMEDNKSINIDTNFDLFLAKLMIESGHCSNYPKKIFTPEKFERKSNKINLLITCPFKFTELKNKISKKYNCFFAYNISKKNLFKQLEKFDAWLCHPAEKYKIDKNILSKAQNLQVILTPSTGNNHIDLELCKKKKISVFSIRNSSRVKSIFASSEFTFALIISAFKKINQAIKFGAAGSWRENENILRGNQLYNKNIGIVGFGRIGSNIAKYANSFDMNIFAYDPYIKIKKKYVNQLKNIKDMLKISDVVCVCIHLDKKNKNFFNKDKFNNLKNNCIFINTSRGEVIDENQLVRFLKNKKIKYAAIDVVTNEHLLPNKKNKIFEYASTNKNLIITPHIAGLSYESELIAAEISIKNLDNFFKKNKLQ